MNCDDDGFQSFMNQFSRFFYLIFIFLVLFAFGAMALVIYLLNHFL